MRLIQFTLINFAVLLFCFCALAVQFEEGDIIFQENNAPIAGALKVLTKSRWTHVGIIIKEKDGMFVAEAGDPVKKTPLQKFIDTSIGDYAVKRLDPRTGVLSEIQISALRDALSKFYNVRYDYWFEWSDTHIYCSELVWKAYAAAIGLKLSAPQKMKDFDLNHPLAKYWIEKLYTSQGKTLNPEEPVVSPAALFDSPLLIQIYPEIQN